MKFNHWLVFSFFNLCLTACSLPIGQSLLVNQSSSCSEDSSSTTCNSTTSDQGGLEIQATSSAIAAPIETADQVEITGSCKDLGRKNNRILVEVYAGEDESQDPYINNTISDSCYPSTNATRSGLESVFIGTKSLVIGITQTYTFSASGGTPPYFYSLVVGAGTINAVSGLYASGGATGTDIVQVQDANGESSRAIITILNGATAAVATADTKKCFSVTKGIGRVEDAGLPNERTFPQCHNGQFGFSVRLGKTLMNSTLGQPNLKYLVRYKLRTQEGSISDSTWGKVTIERGLTTPAITSVTNVHSQQKCTIKNSPARFNPGILYTLNRTFTDIIATRAGSVNLYTNTNTLGVTAGLSVFEWDDIGLTDGVTYNYTLTATDENYAYASPLSMLSTEVTCTTKRIYVKLSAAPAGGTCYLALQDGGTEEQKTIYNPYVTYEWGYSAANAGWIGADGKATAGYIAASCGNTAVCTQTGLAPGSNYFFALRAKNLVTGEIGIWSPVVACSVTN